MQDALPGARLDVERDAALGSVVLQEHSGGFAVRLVGRKRGHATRRVAAERLNLDRIGARIGEQFARERGGDFGAELNDAHAVKQGGLGWDTHGSAV